MPNTINYTVGGARQDLTDASKHPVADLDKLKAAGQLVPDSRLSKPSYFDGRFLTANDLTREQTYMLTRQADVASTYRGGVVRGMTLLRVGNFLRIDAGSGFTPSGQLVTLANPMQVAITQVPEDERIDLSNGLVDVAEPPAATRSGLYVLGLRPDEYASNPITRYPLGVSGSAGVSDGDIVEVAALALHPLAFTGTGTADQLRGELAHALFLDGATGMPADLLALAIVQLSNGSISWLDQYLVRRDIAAEDGEIVGLGTVDRALREAHVLQYDAQLAELVGQLHVTGSLAFQASRYFTALPPVGKMPVAAIDQTQLTQSYFPSEMTVQLSVVVDTEVPALLEAAFHLPPLDLTGGDDDFDNAYVQVLVTLPAAQLASLQLGGGLVPRTITPLPVLQRRLPIIALNDFLTARQLQVAPSTPAVSTVGFGPMTPTLAPPQLAAWRSALAAAPDGLVWFVRVPALSIAPAALFDAPISVGKEAKEKDTKETKEKDVKDTKEKDAKDVKEKDVKDTKEKDVKDVKEKDVKDSKEAAADKTAASDKSALADKSIISDKIADKVADKIADKLAAAEKALVETKNAALEVKSDKLAAAEVKRTDVVKATDAKLTDNVLRTAVAGNPAVVTPAITPTPVNNTPIKTFVTTPERPVVGGTAVTKTKDT
ncbi:MAG TPA: hypothetical protein VGM88_15155 [Kofleriaceae bacterium]